MSDEHRRDPRAPLEVEVTLESENNFYSGITGNVSQGGLFIATYVPPKKGAKVALKLKLEDQEFDLIGLVCWVRGPENATELSPAGCGLRWVDINRDAATAILKFVEKRDSIFHDEDD
jgi:uncharacterized protein (TIGR02266 family)